MGVVDFSHAVDAKIVTSFAISPGVRDANGVWTPVEAKKFLAYTQQIGGNIAAAEMFNEPSFASVGGAPKGYDAAVYGKDFKVFHPFVKKAVPEMVILGPGSVGESGILTGGNARNSHAQVRGHADCFRAGYRCVLLSLLWRSFEALHKAGVAVSDDARGRHCRLSGCLAPNVTRHITRRFEIAFCLAEQIWLTETGETACGGNPWAADFIDSFRYLNQLGTLAKRGVQVVIHNTLAASDYALVDETTLLPRPNYWSALLWRKMMGTTVLDAGTSPPSPNLHLYAHCLTQSTGRRRVCWLSMRPHRNSRA